MIIYVCHALFATSTGVNRSLQYLPKKPIFGWYTKWLDCFLQPIPKVCRLCLASVPTCVVFIFQIFLQLYSKAGIVKDHIILSWTRYERSWSLVWTRDFWCELVTSGMNPRPMVWTPDLWYECMTSGMNSWPPVWTRILWYELWSLVWTVTSGMNSWPLVWTPDPWVDSRAS